MDYYIGIDMGTSSVKIILIDETGKIHRKVTEDYQILEPAPDYKEIDPQTWFEATMKGLKTLLKNIDGQCVEAIGFTGQMHTSIYLDKEGNSIRPAILWNDTRTKYYVESIKEKIQKHLKLDYILKIISTGSPATNILWLKENEPKNFKRIRKFLIGPDYLVYRFTGNYSTDYCKASTSSLFNIQKKEWSEQIRQLLELPKEMYPPVKGSCQIAGTVTKYISSSLKLNPNAKVIVGTGDNPAALLATEKINVRSSGLLSLGTSGVLVFSIKNENFHCKGKNILFSLDNKDFSVIIQGTVQSVGSSLNWWIKSILKDEVPKVVDNLPINNRGKNSLLFFPHLAGEKYIFADPYLRGSFLGLSTDTSKEEMTLALLEGISFGIRQLGEEIGFFDNKSFLKVIGGGSKSESWMQILADILNLPIHTLDETGGAAYGAALLAAYGVGKIIIVEPCLKKTFVPSTSHVILYNNKYEQYKKIYPAIKMIY